MTINNLSKLKKELAKVEIQLEKHRSACADLDSRGTMRKARHQINWDYYAQQKFKIQGQIEELEQRAAEEKIRE